MAAPGRTITRACTSRSRTTACTWRCATTATAGRSRCAQPRWTATSPRAGGDSCWWGRWLIAGACVLHGGAGPDDNSRVHVEKPDHRVHVEVCDDGNGWSEQMRSTSLDSDQPPGGWGLMLVGALADRWGVRAGEHTCV